MVALRRIALAFPNLLPRSEVCDDAHAIAPTSAYGRAGVHRPHRETPRRRQHAARSGMRCI